MLTNRTELLRLLQSEFPLSAEPWRELARFLVIEPAELLDDVRTLRHNGVIRRISGIFDLPMLGYESALAAASVKPENLESAGYAIAADPRVSHCYQRSDDDFPLWFTFAVKDAPLNEQAAALAQNAGAEKTIILPCARRFKLGVTINPHNGRITSQVNHNHATAVMMLSDEHRTAIKSLQADLPLVDRPFDQLARSAQMSPEKLLDIAKKMLSAGIMRRYGAVLHHTNLGLAANVMAVWKVDQDDDDLLREVAAMHMISHCYLRPPAQGWPYNFYTMIHCRTRDDALAAIENIATLLNNPPRRLLWTLHEFKKQQIIY